MSVSLHEAQCPWSVPLSAAFGSASLATEFSILYYNNPKPHITLRRAGVHGVGHRV